VGKSLFFLGSDGILTDNGIGNLATDYTTLDPCQDFGAYACGSYAANHAIPENDVYVSVGGDMGKEASKVIEDILRGDQAKRTTVFEFLTYQMRPILIFLGLPILSPILSPS
jgi:hypothetical protein